jgi:hypothetical protein
MYKVIENPKRMTREEIYKEFDGKWIFSTHVEPVSGGMNTAIPRIIADSPFEGDEEKIYDIYIYIGYTNCVMDLDLRHTAINLFGQGEPLAR